MNNKNINHKKHYLTYRVPLALALRIVRSALRAACGHDLRPSMAFGSRGERECRPT